MNVSDNLRDRITAVLYDHWSTYGNDCECGWNCAKELSFSANYEAHVADAVIAALGLRQETVYAWHNNRSVPTGTRHVTDWSNDV